MSIFYKREVRTFRGVIMELPRCRVYTVVWKGKGRGWGSGSTDMDADVDARLVGYFCLLCLATRCHGALCRGIRRFVEDEARSQEVRSTEIWSSKEGMERTWWE